MKPGPINPAGLKQQSYYNHAVLRYGQPLFLTGQVAWDAEGNIVGKGDIHLQVKRIWDNIRLALAALHLGPESIVKLTTFALSRDFIPALHLERAAFFADHEFPASTFVVVAGLAEPELLAEIEVTVIVPHPRPD